MARIELRIKWFMPRRAARAAAQAPFNPNGQGSGTPAQKKRALIIVDRSAFFWKTSAGCDQLPGIT
jgi:hypothetical protein